MKLFEKFVKIFHWRSAFHWWPVFFHWQIFHWNQNDSQWRGTWAWVSLPRHARQVVEVPVHNRDYTYTLWRLGQRDGAERHGRFARAGRYIAGSYLMTGDRDGMALPTIADRV